jgi:lysyl-tRNA synthetase class 2
LEKGRLGDEAFGRLKQWTDSGDLVGCAGTVKRTEKGELSVHASEWTMLTKVQRTPAWIERPVGICSRLWTLFGHCARGVRWVQALLPLPDKFKGFTDVSKRYRQRHLDLIVNPEVREESWHFVGVLNRAKSAMPPF